MLLVLILFSRQAFSLDVGFLYQVEGLEGSEYKIVSQEGEGGLNKAYFAQSTKNSDVYTVFKELKVNASWVRNRILEELVANKTGTDGPIIHYRGEKKLVNLVTKQATQVAEYDLIHGQTAYYKMLYGDTILEGKNLEARLNLNLAIWNDMMDALILNANTVVSEFNLRRLYELNNLPAPIVLKPHVGILHRDIKVGNIIVYSDAKTGKPRAKLIDLDFITISPLIEVRSPKGTPHTCAPEHGTHLPAEINGLSDVYSLAVSQLDLLLGEYSVDVFFRHLKEIKKIENDVRPNAFSVSDFLHFIKKHRHSWEEWVEATIKSQYSKLASNKNDKLKIKADPLFNFILAGTKVSPVKRAEGLKQFLSSLFVFNSEGVPVGRVHSHPAVIDRCKPEIPVSVFRWFGH